MERTKKSPDDGKIKWKKIGGGSFRMGNKIIKPGQIFSAYPHEIPLSFRDIVIPLETLPEEKDTKVTSVPAQYKIQKREDSNWYDVVDGKGKKINEKALTRPKALELIETLE